MAYLGAPGFEVPQPMSAEYDPWEIASFFASGATITDTGIWMVLKREIALYIAQSSTAMGIVCWQCSGFALFLRPWSRCCRCGELLLIAARPSLLSRVMKADWAHGYATVEKPTSSTKAADSGSPTSAWADSSPEEPDGPGELAETAVEVSVPTAIVSSETPTGTASPEQIVPATHLPPKEIQESASTATSDVTVMEDCGPTIITRLAQYVRSSPAKRGK